MRGKNPKTIDRLFLITKFKKKKTHRKQFNFYYVYIKMEKKTSLK